MRMLPLSLKHSRHREAPARSPGWANDEHGATAVEFGLVALPFFLFVLGLIGIGLYFFTVSSLEYGVEMASRQIRTGQAQNAALTVSQFRNLVCSAAGTNINCSKLSVLIQSGDNWSDVSPQACVDSKNNMAASTGSANDALSTYSGVASKVVQITLCYQWDLAQSFPFLKLGKNSDGSGSGVLQAATAFRTEPYTTDS